MAMLRVAFLFVAFNGLLVLMPSSSPARAEGLNKALITAIQDRHKSAIVRIRTTGLDRNQRGTGIIISPRGHVLTALHVVGGENAPPSLRIKVTTFDSRNRATELPGDMILEDKDPKLDLALLRIPGEDAYAEVSVTPVPPNAPLLALLWNDGSNVVRPYEGSLSTPDPAKFPNRIVLEVEGIEGNSGSPVFDASGTLVAIMTNKFADDRRFSLAAALSDATKLLPLLTPPERRKCIESARREKEKAFTEVDSKELTCDSRNPSGKAFAEVKAPPGQTIAGFASHEDDVDSNGYGWVGAVMYQMDGEGRIASARLELGCKISTNAPAKKGHAKTTLKVPVRKILTDEDSVAVQNGCIARQ
jgi:hypothetical protein